MTLVAGFPFQLPTNVEMDIYMPTVAPPSSTIVYQHIQTFYQQIDSLGINNLDEKIALFAYLNRLNPVWNHFTLNAPQVFPLITGEKTWPIPNITGVEIDVTAGSNVVDKWWGSSQIGKYGFACLQDASGRDIMPLQWINSPHTLMTIDENQACGLHVMLFKGVTATVTVVTQQAQSGSSSVVPPIYYYTQTGYQIHGPATPPGPNFCPYP
jgi:hypothetical protein